MFVLEHVSIIVSSKESISFYEKLGFAVLSREERGYDELVYMDNGDVLLKIYIDPAHPKRITNPEAVGLRHLGFQTETIEKFGIEIKRDKRGRFIFINDPDGLPIEIREHKRLSGE